MKYLRTNTNSLLIIGLLFISITFPKIAHAVLSTPPPGAPLPGQHSMCTSSSPTAQYQGYNCATEVDCERAQQDCVMCWFCPAWEFGLAPICDSNCAAALGTNNENIGIVCMQPECNGCTECNVTTSDEHLAILRNNKITGEININQFVRNINGTWLDDALGTITGDSNNKGERIYGQSAFKGIGTMMAFMYKNPPASGAEYLADLGTSFGLARPAYAQGVGFTAMEQILPAWKASRNVAYIFFIIAFIASGFAIMFRMKINPQTVIGIQNALPKMIIALILVTFSYAIAGLLIDLSYVFLYLAILAFGQTNWINVATEQAKLTNLNFWGGWGLIYGGAVKAMFSSVGAMFDSAVTGGPFIGGLLGGALASILGVLGALIFWIVALVLMFKLFFALVACYVQVFLLIFIGPLLIAFDALPNSKDGFKKWFNKLLGNIMVFPGVAFMMMVGNIMSSKINVSAWSPPLFGDRHDLAGPIFAYGILMMTAKMPEIIKGLFNLKDEGYGNAIGQAVRGGTSIVRQPAVEAIASYTKNAPPSIPTGAISAFGKWLGKP